MEYGSELTGCDCHEFGKILEGRTGHTASCNYARRKQEKAAARPPKEKKAISKVGKNNLSECSSGEKVTDEQIRQRRAQSYSKLSQQLLFKYPDGNVPCEGCGNLAQAHAHIIPQARCKILHKAELIWELNNIFPSCHECNQAIENPNGDAWKELKNKDRCLKFIEQHDAELFVKFSLSKVRLTDEQKRTIEQNLLT